MAWQITNRWGGEGLDKEIDKKENSKPQKSHRRKIECVELSESYLYRRAFSELSLLDILPKELKDGNSVHCITGGDVDALSYLKCILRVQKLEYVLISTWCMGAEDILQIKEWIDSGLLKNVDFYVGEIFPNQYKTEWKMLNDLITETQCGRVAYFRNHAKIFAGFGDKFHFAVEMSCNINTNPRTENGCITIGYDIFNFYKNYFDGIKSFNAN